MIGDVRRHLQLHTFGACIFGIKGATVALLDDTSHLDMLPVDIEYRSTDAEAFVKEVAVGAQLIIDGSVRRVSAVCFYRSRQGVGTPATVTLSNG